MTSDDELLTVKEAAARISVHPETVRRWIREGTIPHERIGPHGMIRLRRADVDGLSQTIEPAQCAKCGC